MRADLPSGTVTFLFTDVEGSTRLLHELGAEAYAGALAQHRRVIREVCARHGGVEVDTQGDAFFFAFPTAPGALRAALEATDGLDAGPIRVRMGLHTGTPFVAEEGYVGGDVHRVARIAAAGNGGQILVSSSTAALVEQPSGSEPQALPLVDLGEHRFKDLAAPERVYQLGRGEFPALTSLYRTNLPIPATPFLGRERELAEVVALLSREDVRLLALTGPGGTGKTRLALQAAAEVAERFPDGIWWVPLASLRDPSAVPAQIAQAVGATAELAGHVADKRMLLLLDNFEHLLDAAPDIASLLESCPNLAVLATSRELLRLRGEHAYGVPDAHRRRRRATLSRPGRRGCDGGVPRRHRRRDLPSARQPAACARARRRAHAPSHAGPAARAPGSAPRPAQGRPRRRSSPADPSRDDRVVARAPRGGRAPTLREALRVRGRMHARVGRGRLRRRPRHAVVARGQEPRPQVGGPLLDARDDSRVRGGAARRVGGGGGSPEAPRRVRSRPRAIEEAVALAREAGFRWWEANVLGSLAACAVELERPVDAEQYARRELELAREMGDRRHAVQALGLLATLAVGRGDIERAGRLWGAVEADELRGPLGQRPRIGPWTGERQRFAAVVLADPTPEFERAREAGRRMTLEDAMKYVLASID